MQLCQPTLKHYCLFGCILNIYIILHFTFTLSCVFCLSYSLSQPFWKDIMCYVDNVKETSGEMGKKMERVTEIPNPHFLIVLARSLSVANRWVGSLLTAQRGGDRRHFMSSRLIINFTFYFLTLPSFYIWSSMGSSNILITFLRLFPSVLPVTVRYQFTVEMF